jgi:hypothetical protein
MNLAVNFVAEKMAAAGLNLPASDKVLAQK